jgi:branched-chain amino acid transport system permease protein
MISFLTVLFNGIAYGMLLFIMSVGLSVTMGMMNFVNLAQASFSMLGGYVMVAVTQTFGIPFLAILPIAFVAVGITSLVIERLVFRHFYGTDDLTQSTVDDWRDLHVDRDRHLFLGGAYQQFRVPPWLTGQQEVLGFTLERYRVFLVAWRPAGPAPSAPWLGRWSAGPAHQGR